MTDPAPRPRKPEPLDEGDWAELEHELHVRWVRERLGEALDRLTPQQREVVLLRYVEGWGAREIAEATGRTRSEIVAIAREAIAALRSDLSGPPAKQPPGDSASSTGAAP